jgi:hypothetical protein
MKNTNLIIPPPKDDIYKIFILDKNGNTTDIYVFCENPPDNLFSTTELNNYNKKNVNIVNSKQQIHKDDSICIIKKKIIQEIGEDNISYDELYLFSNIKEIVNTSNIYQYFTKNNSIPFTKRMLRQLIKNIPSISLSYVNILDDTDRDDDPVEYEELITFLPENKKYVISIPLGKEFSVNNDNTTSSSSSKNEDLLLFSANPYNLSYFDFQEPLFSFENQLLLNYGNGGNLHHQNIYVCLANDVLDLFDDNNEYDIEKIVEYYYPFLYKKGILSLNDLNSRKQELISENKKIITSQTKNNYKSIDLFYDIFYGKQSFENHELQYTENTGIIEFNVTIQSKFNNIIPLEVIFKNIHATKKIPFIKYNPGNKRENIYRLYTQYKTKDGKFIPYLSESMINKLSKEIGKYGFSSSKSNKQLISMYVIGTREPIYINFTNNGNIHIYSLLKTPCSHEDLLLSLKNEINPIIENINQFLIKTGYDIYLLNSLQNKNITTDHIKYAIELIITKELNFDKYINCISSVFDIVENKLKSDGTMKLRFKRVENFKEMDAQTLLITETYNKTNDINDVIEILMQNYNLNEETAKKRFIEYLNDNNNEKIDEITLHKKIIENPGFPVTITVSNIENKANIEIDNISSIHYLNIISLYFDSILRLNQSPETSVVSMSNISTICKKTQPDTSSQIETIIITQPVAVVQPLQFDNVDELDEFETDEIPFLLNDDEEEEEEDEEEDQEEREEEGEEENIQYNEIDSKSSSFNENFIFDDDDNEDETSIEKQEVDDSEEEEPSSIEEQRKTKEVEEDEEETYKGLLFNRGGGNIVGQSLKGNNSIFLNRMRKRDPILFSTDEDDNYQGYTRLCQSNEKLQPIVLTETEFNKVNKENPNSYSSYIKYGTTDKPNYYICPRYWCLNTNTSMTEEDIKSGKCAKIPDPNKSGKYLPDKIINPNSKLVPKDAFVYEFNHPKHHTNTYGEYIEHHPGFVKSRHPKGFCLPCCYKKPNHNTDQCIKTEENGKEMEEKEKEEEKQKRKDIFYIYSVDNIPIKEPNRFGFLPNSIQMFLQVDYNDFITKNNPARIKPNMDCLLRYSVEQIPNQSILGIFADLYAYFQKLNEVPKIKDFKEILKKSITLDKFIKYNNSYLISVFNPSNKSKTKKNDKKSLQSMKDDIDISKYENSEFYASIDQNNEYQMDFLLETILSFENFINYIINPQSKIDHTYLWDIITDDNPSLIKGGINLIIIEITNNDITDNIKILCPTNSSRNIFDPRKESVILIKYGEYYEPVYLYKEVNGKIIIKRTFYEQTHLKNIKTILQIIEKTQKKCNYLPSLPKLYNFKKNMYLDELNTILKQENYYIEKQVFNYQWKIIGIIVKRLPNTPLIFIPCLPSSSLNDIPKISMDDLTIWKDYKTTIRELITINTETKGKILCLPKFKIMEDKLIVGVLTETNQFIQINPPAENIITDKIPIINSSNYIIADKTITTSKKTDKEREVMIQKITLEGQFYLLFRTIIRNILNEFENRDLKNSIMTNIENPKLIYSEKLKNVIYYIKKLIDDIIVFNEIDDEVLMDYGELSCFGSKCGIENSSYCVKKNDGVCQLIVPKYNLISGDDNEIVYFARIADELIRFNRIKLFMTEPTKYLNITDSEYKINDEEFIILQNTLQTDYFKNNIPYNLNNNVQNVTFNTADPLISQNYSNEIIPLKDQYNDLGITRNDLYDFVIDCVDKKVDIIGNPNESIWKRILPKKSKEIIFKNSPNCSFHVLVYIFQDKYKEPISIKSIKTSLWNGYKELMIKYSKKILNILKIQGKRNIVLDIENNKYSFEQAIMNESYYLTDLDIWVFSKLSKIQVCIFSKNKLRGLDDKLEWIIFGQKYREKHYFIRSPPIVLNECSSYNVVDKSFLLGELPEFSGIVKNMILKQNEKIQPNIQSLEKYLHNYSS